MMIGRNNENINYNASLNLNFTNGVLSFSGRSENTYINSNFYNNKYSVYGGEDFGMVWFSSSMKELRWYFYAKNRGEIIVGQDFSYHQFNQVNITYHWLALGV